MFNDNDKRIQLMAINELGSVFNYTGNNFNEILGKEKVVFNGYPEKEGLALFNKYIGSYLDSVEKENNTYDYRMGKMLAEIYDDIVDIEKQSEKNKKIYSQYHFHQY